MPAFGFLISEVYLVRMVRIDEVDTRKVGVGALAFRPNRAVAPFECGLVPHTGIILAAY
jgi:hypothetical protein